MNPNKPALIFALLFLLFFVSTSNGFANVTAIQEKLRDIQVKLIGEKIKLLQERIYEVSADINKERAAAVPPPAPEPTLSREELAKSLENQIILLQVSIESLRPRAIEEEAIRIERRIADINRRLKPRPAKSFWLCAMSWRHFLQIIRNYRKN